MDNTRALTERDEKERPINPVEKEDGEIAESIQRWKRSAFKSAAVKESVFILQKNFVKGFFQSPSVYIEI